MHILYYPMIHRISYKSYHAMQMYAIACTKREGGISVIVNIICHENICYEKEYLNCDAQQLHTFQYI